MLDQLSLQIAIERYPSEIFGKIYSFDLMSGAVNHIKVYTFELDIVCFTNYSGRSPSSYRHFASVSRFIFSSFDVANATNKNF